MDDLKKHKQGDEGRGSTHSVCNKHNIGGKSLCCECSGKTDCEDVNPLSKIIEDVEKILAKHTQDDSRFVKSISFALLQGFLTEIGSNEKITGYDDAIYGINQERTRLRKVVEGAINNLSKE